LGTTRLDGRDVIAELSADEIDRPRTANGKATEVRYVESSDTFAHGEVFGDHALVLHRHRPTTEIGESGAEPFVTGIERGDGHPAEASGSPCGDLIAEIGDLGRTRNAGRGGRLLFSGGLLEAVLHKEVQVVPLIEDLAANVGVELTEAANLAVLLRHELLVHRRDLDVDVFLRQVEVGPEVARGLVPVVPFDREGSRLVLPRDVVEVEQPGELALAGVREFDAVGLGGLEVR
jgi:hypothetical protein